MHIQKQCDSFALRLSAESMNDAYAKDKKKYFEDAIPGVDKADFDAVSPSDAASAAHYNNMLPSGEKAKPSVVSPGTSVNGYGRGGFPGQGAGWNSGHGVGGGGGKNAPSSVGGNPAGGPPSQSLTEALQRAGISPEMYPLISGFSAAEGNNPSGAPTLGFTDSQAGTTLDQHAQALSKQLKDRASVAGEFPHGGSPQDQASWMATVVGQTGNPSDWQGNAQPARSDYVNRIVQNMPSGNGSQK